jgi:hypothetical protein
MGPGTGHGGDVHPVGSELPAVVPQQGQIFLGVVDTGHKQDLEKDPARIAGAKIEQPLPDAARTDPDGDG